MPSDGDRPDLEGFAEELHVCKESVAVMLLGNLHTLAILLLLDLLSDEVTCGCSQQGKSLQHLSTRYVFKSNKMTTIT